MNSIEINGKNFNYEEKKLELYELVKIHKFDTRETPVIKDIKKMYCFDNSLVKDYDKLPKNLYINGDKCFKSLYDNETVCYVVY